jgi:hypothetical protein
MPRSNLPRLLAMDVASFDRHKRYSNGDHRDRDAGGDPTAGQRHCAAQHESHGNG